MDKNGYNLTLNGNITININGVNERGFDPLKEKNNKGDGIDVTSFTFNTESLNNQSSNLRTGSEYKAMKQILHLLKCKEGNLLISSENYKAMLQTIIEFVTHILDTNEEGYNATYYGDWRLIYDILDKYEYIKGDRSIKLSPENNLLRFGNGSYLRVSDAIPQEADISIFGSEFRNEELDDYYSRYNIILTHI